jgi:hypothetical protein
LERSLFGEDPLFFNFRWHNTIPGVKNKEGSLLSIKGLLMAADPWI